MPSRKDQERRRLAEDILAGQGRKIPAGRQRMRGLEGVGRGGLGDLGEHVGNPKRYEVEPTTSEILGREVAEGKKPPTKVRPTAKKIQEVLARFPIPLDVKPVPPAKPILQIFPQGAAAFPITPAAPLRIDTINIEGRHYFWILNMSAPNCTIWFGFEPTVQANNAIALAAPSAIGAFDGQDMGLPLCDGVGVWATGGIAGGLIAVMELVIP